VSIRVHSWLIFSVPSVAEEFLVLGQKADLSVSNLSLVVRPSSVVRLPSSCIRFPAVTHPHIRHRWTHLFPKSRSAKKWFKKCTFWYIFAQNTFIFAKKMQKSAKKRSFLPSFLAQKRISPIKSPFLLPLTTPFFKISLKNPYFLDFLSFFVPFFFCFLSSIVHSP